MSDESIVLKCEVLLDRIFFPKNTSVVESNSFAIFQASVIKNIEACPLKKIKLKGNVPRLEYGEKYKVECVLAEHHEQYGDTYQIQYMNKVLDLSDPKKQRKFLKGFLSESVVESIFSVYDDVIPLLENHDIESLCKIKGIKEIKAQRIIDEYEDSKDYSAMFMELSEYGLTDTMLRKLREHYKSPDIIVDVIKNNPYDLVNVEGIGFKTADSIAIKGGMSYTDPQRAKGFIVNFLTDEGETGRSYVSYSDILTAIYDTLEGITDEAIQKAARLLIDQKIIIVTDDGEYVALTKYYTLEKNIKGELLRLHVGDVEIVEQENNESFPFDEDDPFCDTFDKPYVKKEHSVKKFSYDGWQEKIKEIEKQQGFDFTDEQMQGIEKSVNNNVVCITGGGGVGKTSTALAICKLNSTMNIIQCALSGKAALRISEVTGLPAATIHKTLGWNPEAHKFMHNEYEKLDADMVIIDEATMINGSLFLALLKAIPTGAKVIILGDVQQLTPIGNCQVFSDILNSNVLPIVRLTKPHRQAMRSGIIPTSMSIANQEQIFNNDYEGNKILGELKDMELDIRKDKLLIKDLIINHFKTELEKNDNDITEVQICIAKRVQGDLSCYSINNAIQEIYNPKFIQGNEIVIYMGKTSDGEKLEYHIRKNDKVINIKNNYDVKSIDDTSVSVFNGNIGIVKNIKDDGETIIDFIGLGEVVFTQNDCKNLELAYACTTHKLQGSQFKSVIVGIDNSSYIMNNAEWLYTAITRAQKYCVLVGQTGAVRKAIHTKEVNNKQTFLTALLNNQM